MKEAIDQINTAIKGCFSNVKTYGLCHLIEDTNETYPSTKEKKAVKVTPLDGYSLIVYHRLLPSELEPSDEFSFGRRKSLVSNQKVRTVLIFDLESEVEPEDVANTIPDSIDVDGYKFFNISKGVTVNRDSNAVWDDEYSESYKDKYVKRYNVYALEYDLNYFKCPVCA